MSSREGRQLQRVLVLGVGILFGISGCLGVGLSMVDLISHGIGDEWLGQVRAVLRKDNNRSTADPIVMHMNINDVS